MPPEETLLDLMRQVGMRNDRPRPAPRVPQSAAQQGATPAPLPRTRADLQAAQDQFFASQRAPDPNLTPRAGQTMDGGGPRNQLAEIPPTLMEFTGLPAIARSRDAFSSGDPGMGVVEGSLGALGLVGMAGLVPRGAPRAPAPRVTPRPQPFPDAAPPRATQGPDVGSAPARNASTLPDASDWHPEQMWHGSHEATGPIEVFDMSRVGEGSGAGTGERAAFFTPERRLAEAFGPAHPYEVRGRLLDYEANGQSYKHLNVGEVLERARREGYAGVRFRRPWETHQYIGNPQHDPLDGVRFSDQIAIFDPANIRPAPRVPDAGQAQGGRQAYLDSLREQGFDVDRPWYHGRGQNRPAIRARPGEPVYLTSDPEQARSYANIRARDSGGGEPTVYEVFTRGRFADEDAVGGWSASDASNMAGVDRPWANERLVYDPANMAYQRWSPPSLPDAGQATRRMGSSDVGSGGGGLRPAEDVGYAFQEGLMSRGQYRIWRDLNSHDSYQIEEVPRSEIILQHSLDPQRAAGVAQWYQGRKAAAGAAGTSHLPEVARVDGRLVLMDGHHRLAAETSPTVRVRIADVDQITSPPSGMRAVQNPENGAWRLVPDAVPDGGSGPPKPPQNRSYTPPPKGGFFMPRPPGAR